jgi:hypothetical protein
LGKGKATIWGPGVLVANVFHEYLMSSCGYFSFSFFSLYLYLSLAENLVLHDRRDNIVTMLNNFSFMVSSFYI